jgi:hypothetical protein
MHIGGSRGANSHLPPGWIEAARVALLRHHERRRRFGSRLVGGRVEGSPATCEAFAAEEMPG